MAGLRRRQGERLLPGVLISCFPFSGLSQHQRGLGPAPELECRDGMFQWGNTPFSSALSSNCFLFSKALKRLREAANSNDLDTGKTSASPTWDLFLEGQFCQGPLF